MATASPRRRHRVGGARVRGECPSASCGSRYGARVVTLEPRFTPAVECAAEESGARLPHQRHEEMYIVQGEEAEPEHLVGEKQVADVCAAETCAARTVALLVDGAPVRAELRALDVETSVARERGAVAAHARRRDAIEQIHAAADALDKILRKSDTH